MSHRVVEGDLQAWSIFDVTQSLLMGRKTAMVSVASDEKRGFLYFKEGQIVAALDEDLHQGESAAMLIFSWRHGTFKIEFDKESIAPNIECPTDSLLLDVARNIDELQRDQGIEREDQVDLRDDERVKEDVRERAGNKLKDQLKSLFTRVAATAEPARARFTRNAFDSLLQALLDLDGSVLFLRPGDRPRIKTRGGFETVKEEEITAEEIEGFLHGVLSQAEQNELRENKEVSTFFHTPGAGSFRVHLLNESGSTLVTFTPAEEPAPNLKDVLGDEAAAERLANLTDGLVVVAGPMGAGKDTVAAAVLQAQMRARKAFVLRFSAGTRHTFIGDEGYCIQREMPAPGHAFHDAVRGALQQRPDVLSLVGGREREVFQLAMGISASGRLVVLALDSQSPTDTLNILSRLVRPEDGLDFFDPLSRTLRATVEVDPVHQGPVPRATLRLVDEAAQRIWSSGDLAAIRRWSLSAAGSPG